MKTGIMAALRWIIVLASVFAPFLLVLIVLFTHPGSDIYLEKSTTDAMYWLWLMPLAAMMLGIYYLTVYVADEETIAEEFQHLDRDHDGVITVEDAKTWPELRRRRCAGRIATPRIQGPHRAQQSAEKPFIGRLHLP